MLKTTLEQWRMFRSVAEYGGFNQAGAEVHKSQSSIYNAVQKLEHSLGVKLLEVKGRRTHLTEAGQLMLRRANYLLDEAAKLEAVAQEVGRGCETRLRIAVDEIFPQDFLYRVLDKVSLEYPMLNIELRESILTGATELLALEKVDLAISPLNGHKGFSEELCQVEFVAVAHPDHPLHHFERPLTFEDLRSFRQIVVRDSAVGQSQDSGWLGANSRWTVSHIRTSVEMISRGLGYAYLPVTAMMPAIAAGLLKPLPLGAAGRRHAQLFLMFNDADMLGPAARTLMAEIRIQSELIADVRMPGEAGEN
ncbi:LysR family transcriptional regulator [Shewanella sp. GXUN23E]|uniref:LysR family transcriptional regulator n=1 Tax=Shewanella sp. GXUN23E TaxID=3422498 RepID=UPI003D7EACE3